MSKIDYFYEASGFYLTEYLTYEEFDDILKRGEVLPLAADYEDWDPDYVEEQIEILANKFEEIRNYE